MVNHEVVIPPLMGVTVHSVILMMMGDGFNVTIVTCYHCKCVNIPNDLATDTLDWQCPKCVYILK